jgi:CDP-6-deoxy-D-xylo-4-hexulose-3-dehydrase
MNNKLQSILKLVDEYIQEKQSSQKWEAGKDWVQYSGPYFDSAEFVSAVNTLLNGWLILGEDAVKFEERFPPLLGKKHGVITNSGSSANLLMMLAAKKYFGWKTGDKVITPVAGFPTTINPILQCGLKPVFVDIELDTLNLNLDQVASAVANGARYITFAHVLGNPPNMDILQDLIAKYNLILLEDCCDALGSSYRGKLLGSYGQLATCSFYPAHHMTMGEGGFVACSNKELEKIARSLREWGRGCYCVGRKAGLSTKGSCGCRFNKWLPELSDEIFDHKYVYDYIGYNFKPIEVQCSIGLEQLNKLPEIHAKRKANYKRLLEVFTPYEEFFHIHKAQEHADVSWFAFPITVRDGSPFKRSQFTTFMEDHKIQTRNYFGGNLLLQPAYGEVAWENVDGYPNIGSVVAKEQFPIATKVTTDTLFLGTSPVLTEEKIDYIKETAKVFVKKL